MAASGVNVLRYSALLGGLFYGFSHQSSLAAQAKLNEVNREYQEKESLIAKAKAEFTRKTAPPESNTTGGPVISDPSDPRFDFKALLSTVGGNAA